MVRKRKKYSQRRTTAVIKRSNPRRKRVFFVRRLGKIYLSPSQWRSRAGKLYFIAGGILVIFFIIVYFLFFTEQFLITNINIEANKNTEENIREYLDEIFNSKKFFILKQNKTINFPIESFKKNIFLKFQR